MKKSLFITLCGTVLIAGTSLTFSGHVRAAWNWAEYTFNPAHHAHEFPHHESEEEEEGHSADSRESRTDQPGEALEREYLMTRDPQTGLVPTERMYAAMEYYAAQKDKQPAHSNGRLFGMGLSSIKWSERGANNIGGRTRAILFDKNDTSGKTVFAGSVGGGLWKCTDITAATPSWTPVNDQFANLAITAIAQDTANPGTMYFGTGEGFYNTDAIKGGGIWKSTNSGATWTRLSSTTNDNFAYVQKMVVAPNGDVYAACRGGVSCIAGGLQKSTNGGTSWTTVIGSGTTCGTATDYRMSDVEIGANGDIYASAGIFTAGHIYRSSKATYGATVGDTGTWTNITPAGSYTRIEIACAPSDSNQIYALCEGSSSYDVTAIFASSNMGGTWTSCTIPTIIDQGANSVFTRSQAWYSLTCTVDPTNSQTVYIGGIDLLRSTNGGTTFSQLTTWSLFGAIGFSPAQNTHADIHTLVFRPKYSSCAIFGSDGGLAYSSNLGNSLPTWVSKNTGYNVTQYYSVAASPTNSNYFLAGAQDNGSQKFTAPGVNSVTTASGGDGALCWIDKSNTNNQITAYVYNNYYVSTNGGTSFSTLPGGTNTGMFVNSGDLDYVNGVLYTGGNGDQLVRWSSVFGSSTRTNLTLSFGGAQATTIKVSPNAATTVYIGTAYGNIYRVTSANSATPSVAQIASGLGGYVSSIDVWKKSTNTDDSIAVSLSSYGVNSVYVTGTGTAASPTWINVDDNNTLQDIPVRCVLFDNVDPRSLYIGTEVGVLGTIAVNGSSTVWQSISNSTLPLVRTDQLAYNASSQLVAATHGRGLFTTTNMMTLPIRLIDFAAAKAEPGTVTLHWDISKADEAAQYVTERMYSGETDFKPTATIGASGAALSYNTTDAPEWTRGDIYYRLRCNASDGTATYSQVAKISGNNSGATFITGVYPSVTNDEITIAAGNIGAAAIEIFVRNMAGQVMLHETAPYVATILHLGALAAGQYIVSVSDNKHTQGYVARVVKQ